MLHLFSSALIPTVTTFKQTRVLNAPLLFRVAKVATTVL